jgi:2-(1,2-epoxy-1,2-dihydrophenyl)acetyl-CoA isomerase
MAEHIRVIQEEEVAEVFLNRPQAFNAFDLPMIQQFSECLIPLSVEEGVRAVVISGEGKAFCAGGDLKWASRFPRGPSAGFHELAARFHQAILEIRRMKKPVIAVINGIAAGGGFSLALACDFRVMARSATLRQAYTSSGLCLDGGGSFTLPRLVGFARALEIAAFDPPISSDQALAWGLVTRVVEDGLAMEEGIKIARQLAHGSIHSFALSKQLLTDSSHTSLETQLEKERAGIVSCGTHPDGVEGLRAFREKRKPVFYGP